MPLRPLLITYVVEAAQTRLVYAARPSSWSDEGCLFTNICREAALKVLMPLRLLLITYAVEAASAQSVYTACASSWSGDGCLLNYIPCLLVS